MTQLQAAFDLLGVPPGSDAATVKQAWRTLVRSYHPDMAKTDRQQANRRLAEINAAFDVVSASIKRDRTRRRAEALDQARRMAEAAERTRLESLARREAAQQAAARAALTEPEQAAARGTPRREAPADRGASRNARGASPAPRAGVPAVAEDSRALAQLALKAAAAFRVIQSACSRDRKAEPRSIYL